jgi:CBS domain-containing protein
MGIWSGVVGFGLGYAAGAKIGDRPLRSLRGAGIGGVGRRTVDVRQVREVMTTLPETVTPATSLRDAAAVMGRADVGDVLVVEGDEVRGILTDRDIAVRAVGEGMDVSTTVVGDVSTPGVVSISPESTVQEAIDLMRQHDVRRLPVVEAGRPIGIVSLGDLAVTGEPASLLADITTAPPNT